MSIGLTRWLVEAGQMRELGDPDQGLVFLHLDHNVKLFGYVMTIEDDLLALEYVTEIRNGQPRSGDYVIHIPIHRIILARYADTSDTDLPKGNYHER